MHGLTARQKNIMQIIAKFVEKNNYPPTYQQLCHTLDISSKNAIKKHIDALVKKGYLEKDSSPRGLRIIHPEFKPSSGNEQFIPLIGHVAAGYPVFAEENIETYIPVTRQLISKEGRYYALKVRGDSMINAGIFDNDLVIVRATKNANNNDIVVALLEDEVTIKRVIIDKQKTYLKAENPAYHNIYPDQSWSIQGKVVGLIRENFN
jgi:repressor LexA